MSKKRSLGRGLGAILDEVTLAYEKEVPQNGIVEIAIDQIRKNPFQPRKSFDSKGLEELAASIKEHGLLQPIVVIEDLDGYMLIAGERRLRAAKLAGLQKIKAIIADIEKRKYREIALIENIQREDLSALELANSYQELIEDYQITHEELANIVKKSRAHITNTLRLLQLSEYAKDALQRGKISAGHAKVLVGLDDEEQRVMVDTIVGQKLSVRDTEKIAKKRSPKKRKEPLAQMQRLKEVMEKTSLKYRLGPDRITIEFTNGNDIEKFLQYFSQNGEI